MAQQIEKTDRKTPRCLQNQFAKDAFPRGAARRGALARDKKLGSQGKNSETRIKKKKHESCNDKREIERRLFVGWFSFKIASYYVYSWGGFGMEKTLHE